MTCEECSYVFTGPVCPQCGTRVKDYGKKIETTDDDLVEVGKRKKIFTMDEKRRFFQMLEYERRNRGYAPGWSAHKYRERHNCWPKGMKDLPPIEPDTAFLSYMKYLRIRWAKSKQNPKNNGDQNAVAG